MIVKTSIDIIRKLMLNEEKKALAYTNREFLFQWYAPWNITGLDESLLRTANSKSEVDAEERDDEIIFDFINECVSQRLHACFDLYEEDLISTKEVLKSFLYLARVFGTKLDFSSINRNIFEFQELSFFLFELKTIIEQTKSPVIRRNLIDFTKYFFCYEYCSPELSTLPEINKIIEDTKHRNILEKLF